MTVAQVVVRRAGAEERSAVARIVAQRWGSTQIVSRDRVHDAEAAEAFVALRGSEIVGSATFVVHDAEAELLTLDSLDEGAGIGGALVDAVAVAGAATAANARQLVLSTTNDNLQALGFYQRRGSRLTELVPGAIGRAREHKPSIPLVGSSRIPIRDELVLVRDLDPVQ
ncbi:MAG: GNAT family N-acetyltransferase [Acidimicrobiales bacterium]